MIKNCPYCNTVVTEGHDFYCPGRHTELNSAYFTKKTVKLEDVLEALEKLTKEVEALKTKIDKILDYLGVDL